MKNAKYKIILCVLIVSTLLGGCLRNPPSYRSWRIFEDTPAWELAKAVESNNLKRIEELVMKEGVDINYQDPVYNETVLVTATMNMKKPLWSTKLKTIEKLLELGADPNIYANLKEDISNAVTIACSGDDADLLTLLLQYGGDPNSVDISWTCGEMTALMMVSRHRIDDDYRCMDLLIEYGADVNATTSTYPGGALEAAYDEYKSILILLENGADPNTLIHPDAINYDMPVVTLPRSLRYHNLELNDRRFKYKQMVKEWLKTKGIADYDTIPIPESAIEYAKEHYPDTWQEYLKIY